GATAASGRPTTSVTTEEVVPGALLVVDGQPVELLRRFVQQVRHPVELVGKFGEMSRCLTNTARGRALTVDREILHRRRRYLVGCEPLLIRVRHPIRIRGH